MYTANQLNAIKQGIGRRNKKLVLVFIGAMMMASFTGCEESGSNSARQDTPDYVFTYAESQAEDYPTTLGAYKFAELVKEKTNGKIEIQVQADGALGDETSVIEQLQFGGIDFARVSLSPLAEFVPKLNVLQLPYLYTGSDHMWNILDGEIGQSFLDELDNSKMVPLSWYEAGTRNFYNSQRPIEKLEDLKGLNIRVQESELMKAMIEALGANPIPMAYAEVYSGLQTGVIDGAENNWPSYESTRHYEVAKYYTIDEHTRIPEIQLVSEVTWRVLSSEQQAIIRECALESAEYEKQLWKERVAEAEQKVRDSGVNVSVLSTRERERLRAAIRPLYETFCGEYMDIIDAIIAVGDKYDPSLN